MKQNWAAKPLGLWMPSICIRQTIGNFIPTTFYTFILLWGMHEPPQFVIIVFLKELGNLIKKFGSGWSQAQFLLRLQKEFLVWRESQGRVLRCESWVSGNSSLLFLWKEASGVI